MENEILDSINEYFKHLAKVTREIDREEVMALWKKVKKGGNALNEPYLSFTTFKWFSPFIFNLKTWIFVSKYFYQSKTT